MTLGQKARQLKNENQQKQGFQQLSSDHNKEKTNWKSIYSQHRVTCDSQLESWFEIFPFLLPSRVKILKSLGTPARFTQKLKRRNNPAIVPWHILRWWPHCTRLSNTPEDKPWIVIKLSYCSITRTQNLKYKFDVQTEIQWPNILTSAITFLLSNSKVEWDTYVTTAQVFYGVDIRKS